MEKVCTKSWEGYLTAGKSYEILKEDFSYVDVIKDDSGKPHIFSQYWLNDTPPHQFEVLKNDGHGNGDY